MESKIENIQLDIQELQKLLEQSQRSEVQNFITKKIDESSKEISKLQQQIEQQKQREQTQQNEKINVENNNNIKQNSNIIFKTISNYSFEQEGEKVKVYFFLDKIGDIPRENITHTYEKNSLSLQILNYNKSNLIFKVPKLSGEIDVEKSKLIVKSNRITMILYKSKTKHWDQLAYKEQIYDEKKDKKPDGDIMGLMKDMYDKGDDEMKRTLNKAWYESQQKKGKDSMGGMSGMMDI